MVVVKGCFSKTAFCQQFPAMEIAFLTVEFQHLFLQIATQAICQMLDISTSLPQDL
jgi:hypothetical protein